MMTMSAKNEDLPFPKKQKTLKSINSSLKQENASLENSLNALPNNCKWKKITAENLNLDYTILLSSDVATNLFDRLEGEVEYFTGELSKVKVFGKWHNLSRKQATYGDDGLTYKYSGIVTPARPWPPSLLALRNLICRVTGYNYNFVLVNRYKDGLDKMGEHKDDEKELDPNVPIASLSVGQPRDFYFKHQDVRRGTPRRNINKVALKLEHGSLLLMNPPTNRFWYHALPPRKNLSNPRINLTFRKILNIQTK